MQKQIKTFFAFNDFEINTLCSKPPTFEGFAENACRLFFPEIEKINFEKVEPKDLIPIGFLEGHTYYNTIYYPRALEWKFIFDYGNNKAKDFENDLAIIVWYIGKSFVESKKNDDEIDFDNVKQTLNKNSIYLPNFQMNWLAKQETFIESIDNIFNKPHNEQGFEKTKSLALQFAINPKFAKRMQNELKTVFNMVDEDEILNFVFIENNPIEKLEKLAEKSEHYLKILFDFVTVENVDNLIKKNVSLDMYKFLRKFKMPEDLAQIIKIYPEFYEFINNDDEIIKKILSDDKSKSQLIANLIKYIQKKGNDQKKINCFLKIINKNESATEFLFDISKTNDLETVDFLMSQYEQYFSANQSTNSIAPNEAMAIYLNLYLSFGFDIAQKVFKSNESLNDLKNNLLKEDNDLNLSFISHFLVDATAKLQASFIKNLSKNAQNQLKFKLSKCKNFALKMKLAPIISQMKG